MSNCSIKHIWFEDVEYIECDNVFQVKEIYEYAMKHNYNVKFTRRMCTYTDSVEALAQFQTNGFEIKFAWEPLIAEGREIGQEVVAYLTHPNERN